MTKNHIYDQFGLYFPWYDKQIETRRSNGKNSVRIRLVSGQEFIFSYQSPKLWKLETVDSFLQDKKGG